LKDSQGVISALRRGFEKNVSEKDIPFPLIEREKGFKGLIYINDGSSPPASIPLHGEHTSDSVG